MKGYRALIGLAVIAVVGFWFTTRAMTKEGGRSVLVAFGNVVEDTIEIHTGVEMGMVRREGPRLDRQANPLWEEWVQEHWKVRDATGAELPIERIGQTLLIDVNKVPGAPEFFLKIKLQRGKQYTFDYIPARAESKCYRWTFTAPDSQKPMHRPTWEPAERKL